VLQEILLAERFVLLFGGYVVMDYEFESFCKSKIEQTQIPAIVQWIVYARASTRTSSQSGSISLYKVLENTADSKCEDPRDHTHSLQSLILE
jgi:hypothetical protein